MATRALPRSDLFQNINDSGLRAPKPASEARLGRPSPGAAARGATGRRKAASILRDHTVTHDA